MKRATCNMAQYHNEPFITMSKGFEYVAARSKTKILVSVTVSWQLSQYILMVKQWEKVLRHEVCRHLSFWTSFWGLRRKVTFRNLEETLGVIKSYKLHIRVRVGQKSTRLL